ncbi:preprotein translocase subunit SecA [Candidatus Jorgensenbacteria bacterium CG11_big_fil_rev_8_21_14_0_20_38_23]|uniref:Protein translocase subunit SecA n=1 Tax=Candidatus Jorgensenbacteria bacterium CG11_big_fil_rev_8_21_14_0_20_38_23 TaxID=1974594 RepID=A0A2H0NED3_9BACT|nr:MAG: preprotein translocase subunit SecA [Candidatus Jorgensenbacteria bacterium CG11_big_fil_rev_8_21_14_0_20_38_23]
MISKFFQSFFGQRILKEIKRQVEEINKLEPSLTALSDEELKNKSSGLKERIKKGESEDEILTEAFALTREASRRTLGQRHFDVQLMGGIFLHQGKIIEMFTGEGKTLAATGPAYLNALSGKGVHIVTVNDYLARRDTVWMGQIYDFLGLKVSCLVHDAAYLYDPEFASEELDKKRDELGGFMVIEKFLRPVNRKEAYLADITYGTNQEFGFDYLRDNLVLRLSDKVQRPPYYGIIDEVDNILIDEARTPLIIAIPDTQSSQYYKVFAQVAGRLSKDTDYQVDEKTKTVNITEEGIEKVEKILGIENIYGPENFRLVHYLQESLKAKELFRRDRDYLVKNNEVIIVDEFTGRLLYGRRYSGGLHQAIEAKEGALVKEENRTLAQITIQNYFRLYKKIAGMTGTAQTSAEEFHKVYNLDVVTVPTNRPMIRKSFPDVIYKTEAAKYRAAIKEIKERHQKGQPILVGTTSIARNEIISAMLNKEKISHEVLNAKNNEREGAIIAQAGRLKAVTVATNMAGRGVDIILGGNPPSPEEAQKVKELGGLHIIGTERHEARRIDNQLRGRSGRQGDIGSSQFFLSLEDDLLRIFGGEKIKKLMQVFQVPEDTPLTSKAVSRAVNQAQQKVEGANFDIRHHLLDFDDVLNKQRSVFYAKRLKILEGAEKNEIRPYLEEIFSHFLTFFEQRLQTAPFPGEANKSEEEKALKGLEEKIKKLPEKFEPERSIMVGQHLVRILDTLWIENLEDLESLIESVNIRAYGQHEPLVEYRREAYLLFQQLNNNFEGLVINTIFPLLEIDLNKLQSRSIQTAPPQGKKLGRNDPCWCGSGKKYKRCHGG